MGIQLMQAKVALGVTNNNQLGTVVFRLALVIRTSNSNSDTLKV